MLIAAPTGQSLITIKPMIKVGSFSTTGGTILKITMFRIVSLLLIKRIPWHQF